MPYAVRPEFVERCIKELREQKIHPTFAGYLCVRRSAARDGRKKDLSIDFKEFFDTFMRVSDAPVSKPYALPFSESAPSPSNKWFNKNVAGSYAPSSLRSISPFLKVIAVSGERRDALYSLRESDAELALKYLLYDIPIPVVCLSAFLYRDFALLSDHPGAETLIQIFSEEFGFDQKSDDFSKLFSLENKFLSGDYLQKF